jgi:hypothetical protein
MVLAITDCALWSDAPAKRIADFSRPKEGFVSTHNWEGWVGYDFLSSSVLPTHYSLQSHRTPFLRAWVLEGTMDGIDWFVLDSRPDNAAIDGDFKMATFSVARPSPCWKIRVKQAGPSGVEEQDPQDFFALSAFELFGTFYPGDPPESV